MIIIQNPQIITSQPGQSTSVEELSLGDSNKNNKFIYNPSQFTEKYPLNRKNINLPIQEQCNRYP